MSTTSEQIPDNLVVQLEKNRQIEVDHGPSIDDLQMLANSGQDKLLEFGAQTIKLTDGGVRTVFNMSSRDRAIIFEPDLPGSLRGKVKAGVFIHNHPVMPSEDMPGQKTLHILPSEHGDVNASLWSKVVAGYFNVSSQYGLTLNIGIEAMPREDDLTRRLKIKSGAKKTGEETRIWKFFSGPQKGKSFVDSQSEMVDEKFGLDEEETILASFTEYGYAGFEKMKDGDPMPSLGTIRHFLFISWDKLRELETRFGGLDNLFFGDGVDRLTKELGLAVPHGNNLSEVCRVSSKYTKQRNE